MKILTSLKNWFKLEIYYFLDRETEDKIKIQRNYRLYMKKLMHYTTNKYSKYQ